MLDAIASWLPPLPPLPILPHLALGGLVASTAISHRYQVHVEAGFHLLVAGILLAWPTLLNAPLVTGSFDELHGSLQRFAAAFHVGFAVLASYAHGGVRPEPVVAFAKAVTAGLLLGTQFLTAYNLSASSTRGVRFNEDHLVPLLALNGIWFVAELVKFLRSPRRLPEQINVMCQRTQRYIEGRRGSFDVERLFFADAALSFVYCLTNFAFPNQILKVIIKPSYLLDGIHKLESRQFGIYSLFAGIVSVAAINFSLNQQRAYIASRIVTQVTVVAVHLYAHFVLSIYDISHTTPFVIALLYVSLLLVIFFRIQREEELDDQRVLRSGGSAKKD